jgi:hypothetical protein
MIFKSVKKCFLMHQKPFKTESRVNNISECLLYARNVRFRVARVRKWTTDGIRLFTTVRGQPITGHAFAPYRPGVCGGD